MTGGVPSLSEIAAAFTRDVTLEGWRNRRPFDRPVEFSGARKALLDHLVELAAERETARGQVLAALTSQADVQERGRYVRDVLRQVMGLADLPERTPLRSCEKPAWQRDGYRVEHVVFESRPGYFVTANLYLPATGSAPFPTVLGVSGHSLTGKAFYTDIGVSLAMSGIAVLMTEPAGQGERDEYVDIRTGERTVARACQMHAVAGDPAYLVGWNLGGYRLWDAIRALDYIESRADLDGDRIGVVGTSGGGWESLWLAAIDSRVVAVNSSCYLTTWRRRMQERWRDPEPDPEQDPFGVMSAGLDVADLLLACCPRPVSLGVAIFDYFPVDGAIGSFMEARRLYELAGLGDRLGICVGDTGHGRTPGMRRLAVDWMVRWLASGTSADVVDVPDSVLMNGADVPEEATWCTPSGIVLTSLGGKTSAQLTAERARELALNRGPAADVAGTLRRLLGYEPVHAPLDVSTGTPARVSTGGASTASVTPTSIRSDGDLWLSAQLWDPGTNGRAPAVVLLGEKDRSYDPHTDPVAGTVAAAGAVVLDLDPRGTGPEEEEIWLDHVPLLETNLTADGFLLGRSVLGMRVADVIRAVDLLSQRDDVDASRISVVGEGYGALLALLAGCLDQRVGRVVEQRALTSWGSLTWHREYAWPLSFILPGALAHFDLDDLRASLAPRELLSIEPLDHLRRPVRDAAPTSSRQVEQTRPDTASAIAEFVTRR